MSNKIIFSFNYLSSLFRSELNSQKYDEAALLCMAELPSLLNTRESERLQCNFS